MRQFKFGSAVLVTLILVGCGGNPGDVPAKPKFVSQVSFGDSLSDVGTYQVGAIAASGGGQFTINAASGVKATTPTNWTEFTSISLGLGMPCAAVTGGYGSVRTPATGGNPNCNGYGQGGARVKDQLGIGNNGTASGAMTESVWTQITNYISSAVGNKFTGNEIVFLMAGANDVFYQAALVSASAVSATSAVAAVQTAATQLADAVNTQIIGNGAKYVLVANIPDIASTPYGSSIDNHNPDPNLNPVVFLNTLVTTFNAQLKVSLPDSANVLNVDAYTASKDEVANPGKYNLSITTSPACNVAALTGNSSLFCNAATLVTSDTHYLFADMVHPTPYGHLLFATYVLQAMTSKGWY